MNLRIVTFIILIVFSSQSYSGTVVNDVTNINPIAVNKVIAPKTSDEIKSVIKNSTGPISIGGGRFSMGGQTATENALHFDMRSFNKILDLDLKKKQITVQSGATWRDIQDAIDKHDLSIKIMQTYSNFTVGGSLSVNAHGRYIGEGPLIRSIESIKIILASGEEVLASPKINTELFFSAIGGYGGIGVITEATLNLVRNEKIKREIKKLPTNEYRSYFLENIRDNKNAVFHNGDIYPPKYKTVALETWHKTKEPLTTQTRLIPRGKKYWLEPNAISSISTIPFGSEIRKSVLDPILHKKEPVTWRNYEASYDVAQLEPTTPRLLFTYVLQEYFIPIDKFDEFIPKMRKVFKKNKAKIINVSIRHALPDTGSYLAWAPDEVFSFVVYYKQGTSNRAKRKVEKWTKEMIDEALSVGGRYYLPYQIHATDEQFKKAYPNFDKFFKLKKKVDPDYRFRNKLWDKYYK